jgi:hypothetical protein
LVFNNSYKGGGGADYACNKIALYQGLNTPTTTANNGFGLAGEGVEYFTGNSHVFYTLTGGGTTYGTERMRIASNGNIGIGTTNPQFKLDIYDGQIKMGYLTSGGFDTVIRMLVYGSDNSSVIASFKHPNNSQGIGIMWDGIRALGNGSQGVGTGNQPISLIPLGTGAVAVLGNLTATGTKSWRIKHPILENKDLIHVCIESPRADNLYRGRKHLINGECEVNLDLECNTTGGMTEGCFVLINKNIQVFVNNNETFDKVVGSVVGNKLTIRSDNVNASYFIDWLVIGERNDDEIINNLSTSSTGSVIIEIDREVQHTQENMNSSNSSNVF